MIVDISKTEFLFKIFVVSIHSLEFTKKVENAREIPQPYYGAMYQLPCQLWNGT